MNLPKDEHAIIKQWIEGDFEMTLEATRVHIEAFTFNTILGQTIRWNITQAQREIAAGHVMARTEIAREDMRAIAASNDWTEDGVTNADPTLDGIAAPLFDGNGTIIYVLIDGTHRLVRALREGRPFFAKALTDEANRRCVIDADSGMVP
jgi:hypothetical protein